MAIVGRYLRVSVKETNKLLATHKTNKQKVISHRKTDAGVESKLDSIQIPLVSPFLYIHFCDRRGKMKLFSILNKIEKPLMVSKYHRQNVDFVHAVWPDFNK